MSIVIDWTWPPKLDWPGFEQQRRRRGIMEKLLLCDEEGVPCLVQDLRYDYGRMVFEATFFNGLKKDFLTELVCPSMDLMQKGPTRMQYLEALNTIEKYVTANYRRLFPMLLMRRVK